MVIRYWVPFCDWSYIDWEKSILCWYGVFSVFLSLACSNLVGRSRFNFKWSGFFFLYRYLVYLCLFLISFKYNTWYWSGNFCNKFSRLQKIFSKVFCCYRGFLNNNTIFYHRLILIDWHILPLKNLIKPVIKWIGFWILIIRCKWLM